MQTPGFLFQRSDLRRVGTIERNCKYDEECLAGRDRLSFNVTFCHSTAEAKPNNFQFYAGYLNMQLLAMQKRNSVPFSDRVLLEHPAHVLLFIVVG